MSMNFEQGSQEQPRGHAILYYRSPTAVLASYIVVLPLMVDFSKYIPPFMATQVKDAGLEQFSAFAMPPLPERVESYEALENLASVRGDDLIFGGDIPNDDFLEAAQRVNDAVQSYAQLYRNSVQATQEGAAVTEELEAGAPGLSVGEVVYSLMSDRDKLGELTKLVGKLRFTMEGSDPRQTAEAKLEMQTLSKHLPDSYRIPRLIEVAESSVERGPHLTELYLERCYKLCDEDYLGLQKVEESIQEAEQPSGQSPKPGE